MNRCWLTNFETSKFFKPPWPLAADRVKERRTNTAKQLMDDALEDSCVSYVIGTLSPGLLSDELCSSDVVFTEMCEIR